MVIPLSVNMCIFVFIFYYSPKSVVQINSVYMIDSCRRGKVFSSSTSMVKHVDAFKQWCSVAGKRVCFKYRHKLLFSFIILLCIQAAGAENGKCKAMVIPDLQSVVKQGNIMLAGFFRVHSSKPSPVSTFRESPQQPDCFK